MSERWKKKKQLLETTSSTLIQEALRAGAEQAEVCLSYDAKTKIGFEKQDFHLASSDDGSVYGLRVLVQSKQGFVSGNSTDKAALKEMAETAVRIAKVSPVNEFACIEPSENVSKNAPPDFWDDALVDLSLSTQREWAKSFIGEAIKDSRFRLNEGALTVEANIFLVANSLGTLKTQRESACSWSLFGMASEGQVITSFDYFSKLSRSMKGLPDALMQSAAQFRESVVSNLKVGPAQSYRGTVIFSPRAVLDILARPMLNHLNGRNVVEGAAKFKPSQVGEMIASSELSIHDNPWNTERFGAKVFDREGTPTAPRALIEGGKLASFFVDGYSARALGLKATGNAAGGPTTIPTAGTHNVQVLPGKLNLQNWVSKECPRPDGMLLVNRFSGRTDPATGDFSGVAKGAEWWVRGERAYFVQDTLISGNIFETLSKGLIGLSEKSLPVDCSGDAPYLVADDVSVTFGQS